MLPRRSLATAPRFQSLGIPGFRSADIHASLDGVRAVHHIEFLAA